MPPELERRTREYEDTLARLVVLEEQALARAGATAERYRYSIGGIGGPP